MKKPILVLLALLALLPCAQLLAQTPPVAGPAKNAVTPSPETAVPGDPEGRTGPGSERPGARSNPARDQFSR